MGDVRGKKGWILNRMEKKGVCTDECCIGSLRPLAHPSSDTCPLRGQQGPSAPTTGRYRVHWSKAGWSTLAFGADPDQVRGLAGLSGLVRWLVTVS